ncbi:hypothetical protein D3C81_1463270 [compost metagenome]
MSYRRSSPCNDIRKVLSRVSLAALPKGGGRSMARPSRLEAMLKLLSGPPRDSCRRKGNSPDTGNDWLTFNQSVNFLTSIRLLATTRVRGSPGLPSAKICALTGLSNTWALMPCPLKPLSRSNRKSPLSRVNSSSGSGSFRRA